MEKFLDYIGRNYDSIKQNLKTYQEFDEDIFHNTIIKCAEVISENNLHFQQPSDILRYFTCAYKTNLLRQKLYYHEKNVTHPDEIEDSPFDCTAEHITDINIILTDISEKFGLDLSDMYIKHVSHGISISDLQKTSKIKNIKQKLRNIKNYIIKKYRNK